MITRRLLLTSLRSRATGERLLWLNGRNPTQTDKLNATMTSLLHTKTNSTHHIKNPISFRKIACDNDQALSYCPAGSSNVELDDLELDLSSGHKMVFNLTWLRDSCHCHQCTHQFSRQRLTNPKDYKPNMFSIDTIQMGDAENLQVYWADGHESSYSLEWLNCIDSLYKRSQLNLDANQSRQKFIGPRDDLYHPTKELTTTLAPWTVSEINLKLRPVDFNHLMDGYVSSTDDSTYINANKISEMSPARFDAIMSLSEQLVTYGLGKLINVPLERDQVLRVVKSLAYERPTGYGTVFDVVVEPSEEINLAYSSQEFDLHTDLAYRESSPGVQLLHCIRNADRGGLSYFSDAHLAAQTLRENNPMLFEVLLQFPVTFVVRDPYRSMKFRRQQPILSLDYQGNLGDVHYGPFMLPPVGFKDDVKLFYLAYDKLTNLLQAPQNKLVVQMDPGDLFIFHNRRVLHGRSSYDPTTSQRFLQGCYMDWDEIKCLHEKMRSHKLSSANQ